MADPVMQPVLAPRPERWSVGHRLTFRFFFSYWLLYCLPVGVGLLDAIPGVFTITRPYSEFWAWLVPWVAVHVFHVTGFAATYFQTGAGDTTLGYVQHFCYLVIACAGTILWSLADRKRPNYRTLDAGIRIVVRYSLSYIMFGYGLAKLIPTQFRVPDPSRLIEPFGDFSPMGVLWNFMGASTVYQILTGAVETLGAALLLFRRTTLLGAVVSAAALFNVVLLNFCYDVPVKLYSCNLLFMAIFLLAPDLRRLYELFLLHRPAPLDARRGLRWAAAAAKILFIGYIAYGAYAFHWEPYERNFGNPRRGPLWGLYEVDKYVEDGRELPRWRKIAISDAPAFMAILAADDSLVRYRLERAKSSNTLTLLDGKAPFNDSPPGTRYVFQWSRPDDGHLTLQSDHLAVTLRRIDPTNFPLKTRTFHWINEYPFNR